jgi:hypothetical protein
MKSNKPTNKKMWLIILIGVAVVLLIAIFSQMRFSRSDYTADQLKQILAEISLPQGFVQTKLAGIEGSQQDCFDSCKYAQLEADANSGSKTRQTAIAEINSSLTAQGWKAEGPAGDTGDTQISYQDFSKDSVCLQAAATQPPWLSGKIHLEYAVYPRSC